MGKIKTVFMKKVIFLVPLIMLMIFTSCTLIIPCRIKKEFRYCFDGENTGLDTLINVNGYYAPSPGITQWNNRTWAIDTLKPAFVFYDNGFVFETTCIDYLIENKKFSFFWVADPGGYILHGDTIKLQTLDTPGGQSRELGEIWFKIIDRNTIQRIYVPDWIPIDEFTMIDRITSRKMDRRTLQIIGGDDNPIDPWYEWIFNFRPLEIKIKPEDTWIYNKKWFRCKKKGNLSD